MIDIGRISTFQMVDIHIIHNFIPPCSRLKWKSKFSKSANISLHKSNIRHLKKKVRIFHYINPISVIWNDGYWIYVVKISAIWNCTFFLLYHIFQHGGIKLWIMWISTIWKVDIGNIHLLWSYITSRGFASRGDILTTRGEYFQYPHFKLWIFSHYF